MLVYDHLTSYLNDDLKVVESTEIVYLWDKKRNPDFQFSIDLKDVFNYNRIYKLEEAVKFTNNSKLLEEYVFLQERIKRILLSYSSFRSDITKYSAFEMIPYSIQAEFIQRRLDLIQVCFDWFEQQKYFEPVKKFLLNDKRTNVLKSFTKQIKSIDQKQLQIDLVYGANFRFKAEPGTFNLFNLPVKERDKIIPQDTEHVIYAADLRQFEFRTYLMLHPSLDVDFEQLEFYKYFAAKFNLDPETAKTQILAYLYGKENEQLNGVLRKNEILDLISDDLFLWRGFPIVFNQNEPNYKKIHTLVQSMSQLFLLDKLQQIVEAVEKEQDGTIFIYPFHDEVILSVNKGKLDYWSRKIKNILEDEIYKIRHFYGKNLLELKEIK